MACSWSDQRSSNAQVSFCSALLYILGESHHLDSVDPIVGLSLLRSDMPRRASSDKSSTAGRLAGGRPSANCCFCRISLQWQVSLLHTFVDTHVGSAWPPPRVASLEVLAPASTGRFCCGAPEPTPVWTESIINQHSASISTQTLSYHYSSYPFAA